MAVVLVAATTQLRKNEKKRMKYTINANQVRNNEGNVRGFASIVLGDSFKITNIAILENTEKNQLFVSMPRYKSNERDENNAAVYKDVCNPITKEFREELYGQILEAYELAKEHLEAQTFEGVLKEPEFTVSVTPFEREGSNIRGLARIFFEDSFIVNNVTILQWKDNLFVAMPSYKTKQTDEQGKPVYQDVCYPVTKEFREKLYAEIFATYEREKKKQKEQSQSIVEKKAKDNLAKASDKELPFR